MVDICLRDETLFILLDYYYFFLNAGFCAVLHDDDTIPGAVMGEACHIHESGYCNVSVCATTSSTKDRLLSEGLNSVQQALSVMLGHTAITLLLHNTGQNAAPPPSLHTHTHKYTHIFLAIKINMSFHFGQSQTSCRQR